jgi:hypothetical protein
MTIKSLDEALAAVQDVSGQIIDSYLSSSCPCAFPRYRFLVGFDGTEYSQALLHTYDTNIFVSRSVDPDVGFLVPKGDGIYSCRVCGSTYRYSHKQYSLTFEAMSLSVVSCALADVGAPAQMPFPVIAGVYFVNGAWGQEEYMRELARLREIFPITEPDEFRAHMLASA